MRDLVEMLGRHWQPTPMTWTWAMVSGPSAAPVHVLIIEGVTGRQGLAFTEEALAEFIRTAQTQLTGLALPKPPGLVTV